MIRWDVCVLCCIYLVCMYAYFVYKCGWIKLSQIKEWKKNTTIVVGQVIDMSIDKKVLALKPYTILKVRYTYDNTKYENYVDDRLLIHKDWCIKETIMLKIRKDEPTNCHYLYRNTNDKISYVSFCTGFLIISCLCLGFLYVVNLYYILKDFEFISLEMYSIILTLFISIIMETVLIENLITIIEPYQNSKYKGVVIK